MRTHHLTEQEWRRSDRPSLFLVVRHHATGHHDLSTSIGVSTFNSLGKVGFADGWTLPLRAGPQRHHLLDGATISEFVTLRRDMSLRHLAQLSVKEAYAWDWHYRSDIYATGTSFSLSLRNKALEMLTEKVRAAAFDWTGGSTLHAFAVRLPVRREFAFPEARATEKPYSDGPYPKPLRQVAKFKVRWIEVAALDSERMLHEPVEGLPISDWFIDAGPVRLCLARD